MQWKLGNLLKCYRSSNIHICMCFLHGNTAVFRLRKLTTDLFYLWHNRGVILGDKSTSFSKNKFPVRLCNTNWLITEDYIVSGCRCCASFLSTNYYVLQEEEPILSGELFGRNLSSCLCTTWACFKFLNNGSVIPRKLQFSVSGHVICNMK